MRIFKRYNGIYYLSLQRGEEISLKTRDSSEAEAIALNMVGKLKPDCGYCGKELGFFKQKYCSKECHGAARQEIVQYGLLRKDILSAFHHRCAICGRSDFLRIHHIDGFGTTVRKKHRNNSESNLIVLCAECHIKVHMANDPKDPAKADIWIGHHNKRVGDMILSQVKSINQLRSSLRKTRKIKDKLPAS